MGGIYGSEDGRTMTFDVDEIVLIIMGGFFVWGWFVIIRDYTGKWSEHRSQKKENPEIKTDWEREQEGQKEVINQNFKLIVKLCLLGGIIWGFFEFVEDAWEVIKIVFAILGLILIFSIIKQIWSDRVYRDNDADEGSDY